MVRSFVIALNKNYGQFPAESQLMKKEMLAGDVNLAKILTKLKNTASV